MKTTQRKDLKIVPCEGGADKNDGTESVKEGEGLRASRKIAVCMCLGLGGV